jgi:peptidoglycan-associated lipoprotein
MHHCLGGTGLAALLALSVACGHQAKPETPEPTNPAATAGGPRFESAGEDMRAQSLNATQRAALEKKISFGFDRSDLSSGAKEILLMKAEILRSEPSLMLRIEGHADERGSDEYNLALSNRRAATAMRFLVHHGVDHRRLETVGYGEEQPLDPAENETAWALNRRDEIRVSAGHLAEQ